MAVAADFADTEFVAAGSQVCDSIT